MRQDGDGSEAGGESCSASAFDAVDFWVLAADLDFIVYPDRWLALHPMRNAVFGGEARGLGCIRPWGQGTWAVDDPDGASVGADGETLLARAGVADLLVWGDGGDCRGAGGEGVARTGFVVRRTWLSGGGQDARGTRPGSCGGLTPLPVVWFNAIVEIGLHGLDFRFGVMNHAAAAQNPRFNAFFRANSCPGFSPFTADSCFAGFSGINFFPSRAASECMAEAAAFFYGEK